MTDDQKFLEDWSGVAIVNARSISTRSRWTD